MRDEASLDLALDFLAPFGPDLSNGMTSHAPMVAEALVALDRGDAVLPWLEGYRPLLLPRPAPRAPLRGDAWRDALGHEERLAEWNALFTAEIAEAPWQRVLARWTERLAPGICAAATHGVIRVAHAARALAHSETPPRMGELACALGYWAATHQTLPAGGGSSPSGGAQSALTRVTRVPLEQRRFTGTITAALAALDEHAPFAGVIDLFDAGADPGAAISDLTECFARAFLANAHDWLTAIVFVHGVTSATALRALVPHLDASSTRAALRYAWQAGASLYATFGTREPLAGAVDTPRDDRDALVERAIAGGDEHAIKLVEACLAEHGRNASPVYLAAADRGLDLLAKA